MGAQSESLASGGSCGPVPLQINAHVKSVWPARGPGAVPHPGRPLPLLPFHRPLPGAGCRPSPPRGLPPLRLLLCLVRPLCVPQALPQELFRALQSMQDHPAGPGEAVSNGVTTVGTCALLPGSPAQVPSLVEGRGTRNPAAVAGEQPPSSACPRQGHSQRQGQAKSTPISQSPRTEHIQSQA